MKRRTFIEAGTLAGAWMLATGGKLSAKEVETVLADCQELSRLDYFEKNEKGMLVLADGVADKVIDFHAHLALKYLFAPPIDMDREDEEAATFFPAHGNPVDLTKYSAASFTKKSKRGTRIENAKQEFSSKGITATHTPKNLINEMDRNRVAKSVILAVDFAWGRYSKNSETYLEASKRFPRLIPFVSVHPDSKNMEEKVRRFKEQGAVGMKIHPAAQAIRANDENCMKLTKLCGELDLPCLFHTGESDIAPFFQADYPRLEYFTEPVESQPETTFIMGHGGIHQYRELTELAVRNKNVYIELSGQPPSHIREMLDAGLEDRLVYGSDWPWYIESLPLAKVLLATEGASDVRRKVLYDNAAGLMQRFGASL